MAPRNIKKSDRLADFLLEIRDLMLGVHEYRQSEDLRQAPHDAIEGRLLERIKELVCLHGINEIVIRCGNSLDQILQGIADLLPDALQHPSDALAIIHFEHRTYRSTAMAEFGARLEEPITIDDCVQGKIILGYNSSRSGDSELFLQEERLLLVTVADHVGLLIERAQAEQAIQQANQQLGVERQALLEANIALRTLTEQLHNEKHAIAETIRSNLARSVTPILDTLSRDLPKNQQSRIALLQRCLDDLVSPFLQNLSMNNPKLTPTEEEICLAIRAGLTSKEIAAMRGISAGTVSRHRENIRRKLELHRSGQNLVSYLTNR